MKQRQIEERGRCGHRKCCGVLKKFTLIFKVYSGKIICNMVTFYKKKDGLPLATKSTENSEKSIPQELKAIMITTKTKKFLLTFESIDFHKCN